MTTSKTPDAAAVRRSRIKLSIVALLFVAPVAASYVTFYVFRPGGGGASNGQLVASAKPLFQSTTDAANQGKAEPTKPIPVLKQARFTNVNGTQVKPQALFLRQWDLLYIANERCTETCRRRLYDTRQVRIATDRGRTRIRRVLLVVDPRDPQALAAFVKRSHPDLQLVFAHGDDIDPLLRWFTVREGASAADVAGSDRVYVIDPHGNWFMYYPPGADPKGMLKDLKRVMKASFIG